VATYFIKGYKGKFSIYRRVSGKSVQVFTLTTDNSDEANVRRLLKERIAQLRSEDKETGGSDTFTDANWNRALKYYEAEMADRVKTKAQSKRSAKNALKRAIEAIGTLDLEAATRKELTKEIAHLPNSIHRTVVMNLNRLLKWVGRDFTLELKELLTPTPVYITETEFIQINWPEPKELFTLAFYSGMRIGELFGRWEIGGKDYILLTHQLLINEKTREVYYGPLKNKKEKRFVWVWPEGMKAAREMKKWDEATKVRLRTRDWSKIVRKVTKGALTFHDLRHSYAFYSRSLGEDISNVKDSMGISLTVAERYYAGTGDTPAHILAMRRSTR
jgi:integrase